MIASLLKKDEVSYGIGEVVDNNDPKGANRVKVSLYGITEKVSKKDLPFYSIRAGANNPNTNIFIPDVGSIVKVELKGDIYNGVVIATISNIPPM